MKRLAVLLLIVLAALAESTPLHVVYSSPHEQVDAPENGIVVTFDRPMVALGPALPQPDGPLKLQPELTGAYRWIGVNTLVFEPTRWPQATSFTATVPAGTRALDGSTLATAYSFKFRTRPPVVEEPDLDWTPQTPRLTLTFNQPMDPARAAPFLSLTSGPPLTVKAGKTPNTLTITAPLKESTSYQLVLKAGLPAREGNLGLEHKQAFKFRTSSPLTFKGLKAASAHDPGEALSFEFSNPIKLDEFKRKTRISPTVPTGDVNDFATQNPALPVTMKPNATYTVTVSPDLKDIYGYRLGRELRLTVKTTDRPATLVAPVGARTFESYLGSDVPMGFLNTRGVRVRAQRLDKNNLIPTFRKLERWAPTKPKVDRLFTPSTTRNVFTFRPFDIHEVLKDGAGLVAVRLDPTDRSVIVNTGDHYPANERNGLYQFTRLGITAKLAPEGSLVWVTDLETGKSVPGAQVELRDESNRVLWKGQTDADGLVRAAGRDGYQDTYVLATRGADTAFLSSSWRAPGDYNVNRTGETATETLLFSDRGLYRAGDKVHLKGIERHRQGLNWALPTGERELTVLDSRGDTVSNQTVKLSANGSYDLTVDLQENSATGAYQVQDSENNTLGTFQVEAYRPAQFEVKVKAQGQPVAGSELQATIAPAYLFGAPMPNAEVEWWAFEERAEFRPPGWDGYSFTDELDRRERPRQRLVGRTQAKADANGQLNVSLPLKRAGRVTLEATAQAEDETRVTGRTVVDVHPGSVYIGLKPLSTFVPQRSEVKAEVIAVTPEGVARPGQTATVELVRREWRTVVKNDDWVSVPKDVIVGKTVVTTADKPLTVTLKTASPGLYLLRAGGTTAQLYAYGGESVGWEERGDSLITLTPDKPTYAPGDTLKLAISSPFKKARALVTVEREEVIDRYVTDVEGGAPVVSVPLKDTYAPNVYVSVALVAGREGRDRFNDLGQDLARPAFRLGYVEIPVAADAHRLKVTLKTDHDRYAPGSNVTTDIQVTNAAGKGQPAEVTFAAVDEGVLNLMDYSLPDPLTTFFKTRGLEVITCETRQLIVGQRRYGEKGNPGGGGGDDFRSEPGGGYRWDFEATPCWRPSLPTDADGRVRVTFKLPDSLTSFRLGAVAHHDDRFGQGETTVRVNQALSLTPSWPRFVTLGDDGTAGVLVHNQTGAAGSATVSLKINGGEPVKTTVNLAAGASGVARFPLKAGSTAPLKLAFSAQLGNTTDALAATIPVSVPALQESAALRESPDASFQVPLEVPADVLPGSARVDVTLASSALAGLQPALEYLEAYPNECLEQRTSRVFPLVAAPELGANPEHGRRLVQSVLNSLPGLRSTDGGLGLWPGRPPSPFATAYALQLCALAKPQGYQLPQQTCAEALDYLQGALREDFDHYDRAETLATRAYIIKTLAMWGRDDAAVRTALYSKRLELSTSGQAWLLRALKGAEAKTLAQNLLDRMSRDHFEEKSERIYGSPVRTTAVALEALLEAGVDFPQAPQVVQWLAGQRKQGRWRNTQENAVVLSALAAWYRKKEAVPPQFSATVTAGKETFRETFTDRRMVTHTVPLSAGLTPLGVTREGNGTLFFTALLRYAARSGMPAADAGFGVVKTIEGAEGGFRPGQLLRVRLTVATPFRRSFVVLTDPLAGGMELVRSEFKTESTQEEEDRDASLDRWGSFDHVENYDDRVVLTAEELDAGVHRYSYLVRTAWPGRYALPATQVEGMYDPEVFGRTTATEMEIR